MPTSSPSEAGSVERVPTLWPNLLVALLWVAAWGLARVQEYAPHASLWFPPAGLTFGAAIVLGWRGLPGVLFASIAVTLSGLFYADSLPWAPLLAAGVAFGLAHGLSYFLAGRALLRWGEARPTPKTVTLFLVLAPLAALAATAGGVGALSAFGVVDGRTDLVAIGVPWWIGDFVGVVALGPFFAVLLTRLLGSTLPIPETLRATFQGDTGSPGVRTSLLKLAVGLLPLVVSAILVAAWPAQAHASSFLVFFAIIPLTWIAHTEGVARTTLAAAVLSTATAGVGALLGPGDHGLTYQFAVIVLSGAMYFGLALPLLYADNRDLRRRLTTDPLTGAATRPFFLETVERELERAARFRTPVSLILFDVDRFKVANDTCGHPFGDLVLTSVAGRCRSGLRGSDLLGRLGGDEFGILLPMTGLAEAGEIAERLALSLRSEPVHRGNLRFHATASFGVAELDAAGESLDTALERTDRALYEAKNGGRDRVTPALSPKPRPAVAAPLSQT